MGAILDIKYCDAIGCMNEVENCYMIDSVWDFSMSIEFYYPYEENMCEHCTEIRNNLIKKQYQNSIDNFKKYRLLLKWNSGK